MDLGDVNGDGELDALVGSIDYLDRQGAAWLTYGPLVGSVDLADADARFTGDSSSDYCGYAADLADIDDDGLEDVLVGCPYASLDIGFDGGGFLAFLGG